MACITCSKIYSFGVSYECAADCTTQNITIVSKQLETILPNETATLTYQRVSCTSSIAKTIPILSTDTTVVGANTTYQFTDTLSQGLYKFTLTKVKTGCTVVEDYILFYDVDLACAAIDYSIENTGKPLERMKPLLLHYALNNAQGCVCDEDKMKLLYDELISLVNTQNDCGC